MSNHYFADVAGRYSSLESVLDSIFVLESVLESEFDSESEFDFEFET